MSKHEVRMTSEHSVLGSILIEWDFVNDHHEQMSNLLGLFSVTCCLINLSRMPAMEERTTKTLSIVKRISVLIMSQAALSIHTDNS